MEIYLPPQQLTSHQPPALLVARLLETRADGSFACTELLPGAYDLLQCCEAAAQSVAVLMGHCGRQQQGAQAEPAQGMLISLKNARLHQAIPDTTNCRMTIERVASMPPLAMYQATYRDAEQASLMEVTLQIMSTTRSKQDKGMTA